MLDRNSDLSQRRQECMSRLKRLKACPVQLDRIQAEPIPAEEQLLCTPNLVHRKDEMRPTNHCGPLKSFEELSRPDLDLTARDDAIRPRACHSDPISPAFHVRLGIRHRPNTLKQRRVRFFGRRAHREISLRPFQWNSVSCTDSFSRPGAGLVGDGKAPRASVRLAGLDQIRCARSSARIRPAQRLLEYGPADHRALSSAVAIVAASRCAMGGSPEGHDRRGTGRGQGRPRRGSRAP
jgi:hypothetical protein